MDIEEIIIRTVRGEAGEEERLRLERWRAASPENEATYQETARVVRTALEGRRSSGTTPPGAREIIRRAEEREKRETGVQGTGVQGTGVRETGVRNVAKGRRSRRSSIPAWAAAAAVVVLAIGASLPWWWSGGSPPAETVAELRTGAEERRSLELDDGTLVHLGKRSRVEVTDTGEGTEIWLEGRAFIGVAPTTERATVVRTPVGEVEVLGTRFELSSRKDELQLLLVDGRVRLKGLDETEVTAGELAVMRAGVVESVVDVDDPLEFLAWMERSMVFQNTPLRQVAREIGWRYDVEVEITDPELATRTVTTVFDGEPLDDVMTIVCRVVQADCRVDESGGQVTVAAR